MSVAKKVEPNSMIMEPGVEEAKKELLSKYPTKVARKRAKQIVVNALRPFCAVFVKGVGR